MAPHLRSSRLGLRFGGLLAAALCVAAGISSCADPVHDQQVAALGPEIAGIPQGEFHRAGQPCTVCHGPEGPAKNEFSLAGTIFWAGGVGQYTNNAIGVNQASVSVEDSLGVPTTIATNCVGNFYVPKAQQGFAFPILVSVYAGPNNEFTAKMTTQISRATSCGTCHTDPVNYNAVGHIFASGGAPPTALVAANNACPVNPDLAGSNGTGGQ